MLRRLGDFAAIVEHVDFGEALREPAIPDPGAFEEEVEGEEGFARYGGVGHGRERHERRQGQCHGGGCRCQSPRSAGGERPHTRLAACLPRQDGDLGNQGCGGLGLVQVPK